MRHIRFAFIMFSLAGLAGTATLSACGGGSTEPAGAGNTNPGGGNPGGGNTTSTSNAISVQDNLFTPAATTVPVGTTVTWTWGGSVDHNVTFDTGEHSNDQSSGTFSRTFTAAGTYAYHCTIHAGMNGTITVQ